MAITAIGLSTALQSAMQGITSPSVAISTFSDTVNGYFTQNMQVNYSWAANDPSSGTPDPQTTFIATYSNNAVLAQPLDYNGFIVDLGVMVRGAILSAPVGFLLPPLQLLQTGQFTSAQSGKTTFIEAMNSFSEMMVDDIKIKFLNPTPVNGQHGVFIGVATMVSIS